MRKKNLVARANGITLKKVTNRNGRVSYHITFDYWGSTASNNTSLTTSIKYRLRVKELGVPDGFKKVFSNKPDAEKFMSFAILALSG